MLANNKLSTWVTLQLTLCVCVYYGFPHAGFPTIFFLFFFCFYFLYIFNHTSISSAGDFVLKLAHNWWCATELDKNFNVPLFFRFDQIRSGSIWFKSIISHEFPAFTSVATCTGILRFRWNVQIQFVQRLSHIECLNIGWMWKHLPSNETLLLCITIVTGSCFWSKISISAVFNQSQDTISFPMTVSIDGLQ